MKIDIQVQDTELMEDRQTVNQVSLISFLSFYYI